MRPWAARRIRAGIEQARSDAHLVAQFGDMSLRRRMHRMYAQGPLMHTNWLTVAAHRRTYPDAYIRERQIQLSLRRLLADIEGVR